MLVEQVERAALQPGPAAAARERGKEAVDGRRRSTTRG
jgi:hypothetical protein